MSNSNVFNGSNFQQTPIEDAYKFTSFSQYINNGFNQNFSNVCSFCSSNNTINLNKEGSFKQCNNCRKNFKANLTYNNIINNTGMPQNN
jgi:hypothetical protein